MSEEQTHTKFSFFKLKGLFPAVALILFGAVLSVSSNLLLTDKTNTAVQNAQTQAQTVKESSLCQDSPEEEEACVQSEKILKDPANRDLIPGPQGAQGNSGAQGSMGPRGPEGPVGPVGPIGPEGKIGPQGIQGFFGEPGTQGLQGLQGLPGLPGEIGPMGPAGPPGKDGLNGTDGIDGLPGPAGPTIREIVIDCSGGPNSGTVSGFMSDDTRFSGVVICPYTPTQE